MGPVAQRQVVAPQPSYSPMAVVQAKGGFARRRWSDAQREQSRVFWEKKARRIARQEEAFQARDVRLISVQRAALTQIVDADEHYFSKYLRTPKPIPAIFIAVPENAVSL
jgi:hypothetical protein